jgi:hypothetical protein
MGFTIGWYPLLRQNPVEPPAQEEIGPIPDDFVLAAGHFWRAVFDTDIIKALR